MKFNNILTEIKMLSEQQIEKFLEKAKSATDWRRDVGRLLGLASGHAIRDATKKPLTGQEVLSKFKAKTDIMISLDDPSLQKLMGIADQNYPEGPEVAAAEAPTRPPSVSPRTKTASQRELYKGYRPISVKG